MSCWEPHVRKYISVLIASRSRAKSLPDGASASLSQVLSRAWCSNETGGNPRCMPRPSHLGPKQERLRRQDKR
eukprot:8722126-Alexandrium_andersonii.AAC.1